MNHFVKQNNNGFTLIELLVVVAIIGLLATVVMASLQDARQRSENTARNKQVTEYITALELYRDSNPNEGYPSNRRGNSYICLGNDSCQGFLTDDDGINNPTLDEKIEPYIQPVIDNSNVPYSGLNMSGLSYKCIDPTSGNICDEYSLQWYLVGENEDCVRGAQPQNNPPAGTTFCQYSP